MSSPADLEAEIARRQEAVRERQAKAVFARSAAPNGRPRIWFCLGCALEAQQDQCPLFRSEWHEKVAPSNLIERSKRACHIIAVRGRPRVH